MRLTYEVGQEPALPVPETLGDISSLGEPGERGKVTIDYEVEDGGAEGKVLRVRCIYPEGGEAEAKSYDSTTDDDSGEAFQKFVKQGKPAPDKEDY